MNIPKWLAGLILLSLALLHAATLDPSIIHQWTLNETSGTTAYDFVGGWNFQLNRGATLGAPAIEGTGIALNGANGYLLARGGDVSFLESNFTITLWVLYNTFAGKPGLLQMGDSASVFVGVDLSYADVQPDLEASKIAPINSTPSLNDGKWHLLSIVRSGSLATMYLDFTPVQSVADTEQGSTAPGFFYLGLNDATHFFGGTVDDVTIYDRALSQSEIAAQAVPEPGGAGLLGLGVAAWLRRPRKIPTAT